MAPTNMQQVELQPSPDTQAARLASLGPYLSVLPDALISVITCYLDVRTVARLQATSRLLRVFACEEPLSYSIATTSFDGQLLYKSNWRQTALAMHLASSTNTGSSSSSSSSSSSPHGVQLALAAAAARPPSVPGFASDFLYKRWYRGHADISSFIPAADHMQRINARSVSAAEFEQRFDGPAQPVVLTHAMEGWPMHKWTLPALSEAHGGSLFEVSKPLGGKALMAMGDYLSYMQRQCDEEPLYVFDASFGKRVPALLELYTVPKVFRQDLLSVLGALRPDFRWLVLGPARSGAAWHVDPSLTSAWNALISGSKRWALYPPHMVPPGVTLMDDGTDVHIDSLTALQWFLEVLPTLPPHLWPLELLQRPGEVVFVPGGWWHCVLNLQPSVAVTQNFVSAANLERVVRHMAHGAAAYHADVAGHYQACQAAAATCAAVAAPAAAGGCGRSPLFGSALHIRADTRHPGSGGIQQPASLQVTQSQPAMPGGLVDCVAGGGACRSSILGQWLRSLWLHQRAQRPQLRAICERWLGAAEWGQLLGAICERHGLAQPPVEGLLPLCGMSSAVFVVGGGVVVKLFMEQEPRVAAHMAGSEAAACRLLQEQQQQVQQQQKEEGAQTLATSFGALAVAGPPNAGPFAVSVPHVLGMGSVHLVQQEHQHLVDGAEQLPGTKGPKPHSDKQPRAKVLPYVLLSEAAGSASLRSTWPNLPHSQRAAVARALGALLARVHALPALTGPSNLGSQAASSAAANSNGYSNGAPALMGKQCCGAAPKPSPPAPPSELLPPAAASAAAQPARGHDAQAALEGVLTGTFWRDREGNIWSSHLGCIPSSSNSSISSWHTRQVCSSASDDIRTTTSTASRSTLINGQAVPQAIAATAATAPVAAARPCLCQVIVPQLWQPFVHFLRARRGEVLHDVAEGAPGVPRWLQQQLASYLPEDPAMLLGLQSRRLDSCGSRDCCCTVTCCEGRDPCWLHGDVMPGNVMLELQATLAAHAQQALPAQQQEQQHFQEQQQQQRQEAEQGPVSNMTLIDFADCGHGDPVWDFVPLFVACLDCCNADLMRECLSSYWASSHRQAYCKHWQDRGAALSHVLMCYVLLHEEEFVGVLLKQWPALWEAGNTLQALEQQLFGGLTWFA